MLTTIPLWLISNSVLLGAGILPFKHTSRQIISKFGLDVTLMCITENCAIGGNKCSISSSDLTLQCEYKFHKYDLNEVLEHECEHKDYTSLKYELTVYH